LGRIAHREFLRCDDLQLLSVGMALLFPGSIMEAVWRLYPALRALLMP